MKRYAVLLMVCLFTFCTSEISAKKKIDRQTMQWRYEIEAAVGQAVQGNILVKVYTYSKKKDDALLQAGKNAVHGVLFKGVSAKNDANVRIPAQKPIITDLMAQENHKAYFNEFFKNGGKFQQFIQLVNNGVPEVGDVMKVGKEYKVGVKVLVSKDALRKEMERAGIIKALDSGF